MARSPLRGVVDEVHGTPATALADTTTQMARRMVRPVHAALGQSYGNKILGLPFIYKGTAWCTPSMVPTPWSLGDNTKPWPPEDDANTPQPSGSGLSDGVAWPLRTGWATVATGYRPAGVVPNVVGFFLCAREMGPPFVVQNANTPRRPHNRQWPLHLLALGNAPLALNHCVRNIACAQVDTRNAYIDVTVGCSTDTILDGIRRIGSSPSDVGRRSA
ncbi:hypothetical protein BD779DRAFT_1474471 [Infundibulicybe gibba]|nr:hypothetical protein BD779DRAFT_1474471 [Infundibulicybe gibba]